MIMSLDEPDNARIVQCCVKDHSQQPSPHLHVQVHMRDKRGQTLSSEWSLLNHVEMDAFKEAANKFGNGKPVRFHMRVHGFQLATLGLARHLPVNCNEGRARLSHKLECRLSQAL